ncbi:MAG: alpha-ketoglutarate-dependent dioxygenase AlkB [Pseudomonadota bacterium]
MTEDLFGPDARAAPEQISGFEIHRLLLGPDGQAQILSDLRAVIRLAPLVQHVTAWGKPMTVRMTSAGAVGWIIHRGKYRYADRHPGTGAPWPAIPQSVLAVWDGVVPGGDAPNSCLINWYSDGARMGLHQDRDEGDFSHPVVSVSLGDPARFRMGGTERSDPTTSTVLNSGDVVVMGGAARLGFHGVDRVLFGKGDLIPAGGRINITLRVVRL